MMPAPNPDYGMAAQNPDDEVEVVRLKLLRTYDLDDMIESAISKPPGRITMQTTGDSSSLCSTILGVVTLSGVSVVGASSAPASGSSTSQISSTYPTFFYVGVGATIIGTAIAVISLGVSIYNHRRGGESVHGVLEVLTRPFRQGPTGMYMSVDNLKVGDSSVNGLRFGAPV